MRSTVAETKAKVEALELKLNYIVDVLNKITDKSCGEAGPSSAGKTPTVVNVEEPTTSTQSRKQRKIAETA